ncbi:tetraspanin-33-like [Pomacea canaliculata]|uniref:tetraspanin-33-like n=1 Tax=Pomacea canaliculata TaxID=400727 RepID=UPI000D7357AC|nr:tetraspanin-33-like [Pomacea canaliculata]
MANGPPRRSESRARRVMKQLRDRSAISPVYKYVLFFANCLFLLAGIAMLVVSTYVLVQKEKKITYFVEFIFDPSCLLCLAGSITVVVAFLGCGGALRENTGFLRAYYWILSILLLAQVIIIIFVFIFYFMDDVAKKLNFYPENVLRDAIIRYRDDVDMRNFIDDLQQFLGCCGVSNKDDGFLDWNENSYFNCTGGSPDEYSEKCSVPHSCCIMKPGENINYQCGNNALTKDASDAKSTIYTRGCLMAIKVLITDNAWIIGGIVIGILIPQAFFIFCSKTLNDQIWVQRSKW